MMGRLSLDSVPLRSGRAIPVLITGLLCAILVLLRPATALLGTGKNQLDLFVTDVRFRGDHFDVIGETEEETMLRITTTETVQRGDTLQVHFPTDAVQVLKE